MRRWWLWVVLGMLFGGIAAAIWQFVRQTQQYDAAATTLMPPIPDDEFVPRDDPAIYSPAPAATIPPAPATETPSTMDVPAIRAPEAEPQPEEVNSSATTPEPPPNLSTDAAPAGSIETSSPAQPLSASAGDDAPAAEATQSVAGDEQPSEEDETDEHEGELEGITGYCMHCRTKREIQDPHEEMTESGRRAARGTCPVCGNTIFRFLKDAPASS